MTWIILFALGAVVGVMAERAWHRRSLGLVRAGGRGIRRMLLRGSTVLLVLVLLAGVLGYAYANSQFDKIEKVPVGSDLAGGSGGTNYLLVGTDNRPGVDGDRSDTMLVLRIAHGKSTIMSIPRDLFVSIPGLNGQHRINTAYNSGPAVLVDTVQQALGVPIDRYIEINFVSFAGVVDALGGVTIDFPNPATDPKSGLNVQQTGPVLLDGVQALAYVRSRTYTEVIDGRTKVDGTADLGRVKRQQAFLRAILSRAGASKSPFKLAKIGRALTGGLKVDDKMTLTDALRFAWNMGRLRPESIVLPTTPHTTTGGAQVLLLQTDAAQPVLDQLRS